MSMFHALFDGNGRAPFRLAPIPRSGIAEVLIGAIAASSTVDNRARIQTADIFLPLFSLRSSDPAVE